MSSSLQKLLTLSKSPELAKAQIQHLKRLLRRLDKPLKIMEFCGGHTHSLLKYGLDEALRPEIEFLHGPGCPVCVLSLERIQYALNIAEEKEVIFTTYGDLLRVPNHEGRSLLTLRTEGKDIRMLSHAMEALELAKTYPDKKVVFFAIGFETTAPATAFLLERAREENLKNLKVISNHMLTPAVLDFLFSQKGVYVDGLIGPGHVSSVIGGGAFQEVTHKYRVPMVISGFEPLDLLYALERLVERILKKEAGVFIAYERAVTMEGNIKAKELMQKVFKVRETFPWRGLGEVPESGLALREEYAHFDGELIWEVPRLKEVSRGCMCGKILQGLAKPIECRLFGRVCTPGTPIGPCMVSSEGACLAYFKYKKF